MLFRNCICLGLFVVLLASSNPAFSQKYRHPFDAKKFNLGFLMALNYNMYNLKEQRSVLEDGVLLKSIEVLNKPGLSLGMITNFRINDNISFRFIPQVSLEQRDFNYNFARDSLVLRKIEASYLNLPFLFQFRSNYYKVYRLYTLAGLQLGINMQSNKKVRNNPDLLKIQSQDISLVVGAGFSLYGDRIKLSPEIMYSVGLSNIYVPEFTSHASAISLLFSQVIKININFE